MRRLVRKPSLEADRETIQMKLGGNSRAGEKWIPAIFMTLTLQDLVAAGWGGEEEEVQSTAPGCLVCMRTKSGVPAETGNCSTPAVHTSWIISFG